MSTVPIVPEDVQGDDKWMSMHRRFLQDARDAEPEVLWIGDSLIQNLCLSKIWEKSFCAMHSLNFGIGGDRTEHVLWRLENGELENISPKIVVVLVGTNNHGDTPEQIAEGLKVICTVIRDRQPQSFVLLLSLLPRGHQPNSLRDRNKAVNGIMEEYVKGNSKLQFVNIDTGFIQADKSISHHDMYDYLHLTQKGYSMAFEPVNELLIQLLQEMEGEVERPETEGCAD
ncbi:platelet-activating factor acetylhydrolase IB subunit gamma [Eurytemora carolleeae]|uniref:platelet-activating factor acetylhydrolase IB subunit gamma n=1 Tax=Eurytemora carolleeae TaxID=1294199 RepID=UPI000C77074D|nr:platelet-activating factor acetylhydrolase IB subunit gamma [Eurytemora carolleeae]|eukprot:XP_023345414.1 platelet-activating factor acetylhydrolase IB subunit gamma-like [Eurytemora affinis]